jgi:hypothetical protein
MANRIMWCLPLLLIAGCSGPASVSSMSYGDKTVFVSVLDEKPYLVIVTDGTLHGYSVSVGPFMPAHVTGALERNDLRMSYSAKGKCLSMADNEYDLSQGRLFAVSMVKPAPVIHQFELSQKEMLKAFLDGNAELKEFFRNIPAK